jgi:peptidoglycan/xylan/chitin deacetylase (PgdA/CDA1 family)
VDAIVSRAIEGFVDGSILLLHDGRSFDPNPDASQVVEALPRILREAQRRGFRLLTVSQLLMESNPSRRSPVDEGGNLSRRSPVGEGG